MSANKCFYSLTYYLLLTLLLSAQVHSAWWFLSKLQLGTTMSPRVYCSHIPGLDRYQRQLCDRNPDLMVQVGSGASLGIEECQRQFQNHRWNCSTLEKDSTVFGKSLVKSASRESAFVYSISSAGVTYAITRACSSGELANCTCDNRKTGKSRDVQGDFTWSGCSVNTRFASNFARRFIDAREIRTRDSKALVNLHNNRVGRKAVHRLLSKQCKCHGISGSCNIRTCWQVLPSFHEVGSFIKQRYDKAVMVTSNPVSPSLLPANGIPTQKHFRNRGKRNRKHLGALDLVYLEPSPDYCSVDPVSGSLGTGGRLCNRSSSGIDGCDSLCCGRGYDTKTITVTEACNCTFKWCCSVECKTCTYNKEEHTCKPLQPYEIHKLR